MNLTNVNGFIIFLGTLLCLLYFYMSKEHTGTYGRVTQVGRWFMMAYFGITFGNVGLGRVSVTIWTIYGLTPQPQIYVVIAAVAIGVASILYSRSKKAVSVQAATKQ